MKKKVLSALLAVALFAGMAVPAFAATRDYNSSSQTGEDDEITSLEFKEDSYTVENGNTKNLLDELTAYAGTKKIVQDPTLEWSISDSVAFGVNSDGEVSNIGEDKGSAIVTVTANEGKVKATTKVVATKSTEKNATGFKFVETKYTFSTTTASQEIKIAPTPSGAKFTQDQAKTLANDFSKATITDADGNNIGFGYTVNKDGSDIKFDDDNNIVFNITANAGTFAKATKANTLAIDTRLLKSDYSFGSTVDNDHYYSSSKRTTKIVVEEAKVAEKVVKTGTVNIQIGETVDLDDYIAFGPSSANYGKDVTWSLSLYNDDSTTEDYAVQKTDDSSKIMGVAVGRLKAVATLDSTKYDSTAEVIINVLEKGAIKEGKLSASTAEISVGTQVKLSVSETKDGAKITWKVDNDNATIDPYEGASTIVRGKKAGTSVVTAYVDGKEIGTCTITVKAASTSTPDSSNSGSSSNNGNNSGNGSTNNAQTGDSLFSNLF